MVSVNWSCKLHDKTIIKWNPGREKLRCYPNWALLCVPMHVGNICDWPLWIQDM